MAKKQLDLDAPLPSVRRLSSMLASSNGRNTKMIEKSIPHRQHSLPLYLSDTDLTEVTKPAAVPFLWEQIPGRPKEEPEAECQSQMEPSNTPRLPPGRPLSILNHLSEEAFDDQHIIKAQIAASLYDSTVSESLNKGVNDPNPESTEDVYSDAFETLSPTESFSFDCSVSGLSSCDGAELKSCRTFSADLQTRDFMMSRFLPAAKAMVLDTPQYLSRKHSGTPEQARQAEKVSKERRPVILQTRSSISPQYNQHVEDTESEIEEDECIDSLKKPAKVRGLFARFCIKNSLCLLNPIPAMKARTRVPTSPAKEANRISRSACSGPLPRISDKNSWDMVHKPKLNPGSKSQELHVVKKKPASGSNRLAFSGELRTRSESPPFRSFRGGRISPYRNQTPQSAFRGNGFVAVPKIVRNVEANRVNEGSSNFKYMPHHQSYKQPSAPTAPTIEKTMYVDSLNIVDASRPNLIYSQTERTNEPRPKDFTTSADEEELEEAIVAEIFAQDKSCPHTVEEDGTMTSKALVAVDYEASARNVTGRNQANQSDGLGVDSKKEDILKLDDQDQSIVSYSGSSLPPPLPKSPSESWLWRTLPSIPLKSQFQSHLKRQNSKASSPDTKWETIVKTSNKHHDHVRYSEELVPRISQQSKA